MATESREHITLEPLERFTTQPECTARRFEYFTPQPPERADD